jgi:hypothetical protein
MMRLVVILLVVVVIVAHPASLNLTSLGILIRDLLTRGLDLDLD